MGQTIRARLNQPAMNQVDREGVLYKTASETAIENWLSLGRYLVVKKRYDQARATYQRILDTYSGPAYRAPTDVDQERRARSVRNWHCAYTCLQGFSVFSLRGVVGSLNRRRPRQWPPIVGGPTSTKRRPLQSLVRD